VASIPGAVAVSTQSKDRKDYVYHPETGEKLSSSTIKALRKTQSAWNQEIPDVQLVISDGLNVRSLEDEGHLLPFIGELTAQLKTKGFKVSSNNLVFKYGRVRAGYATGEALFGTLDQGANPKGIIHIIGERPGTEHRNFSTYITSAPIKLWSQKGKVDHDITRVVSGISDTAYNPKSAAQEVAEIYESLAKKPVA
jgi:ethanolamine ammonia-lyase large subunit